MSQLLSSYLINYSHLHSFSLSFNEERKRWQPINTHSQVLPFCRYLFTWSYNSSASRSIAFTNTNRNRRVSVLPHPRLSDFHVSLVSVFSGEWAASLLKRNGKWGRRRGHWGICKLINTFAPLASPEIEQLIVWRENKGNNTRKKIEGRLIQNGTWTTKRVNRIWMDRGKERLKREDKESKTVWWMKGRVSIR